MKSKNKKRRLLFQVAAIVLPLFLLLAVIICQQVYSNSVDSFLEAQNSFIEERIDLALQNISLLDDNKFDDNAQRWLIDYLEKDGAMVNESLTEAEEDKLRKYFVGEDAFTNEWFLALPEDIKQLYTRQFYLVFIRVIESAVLDSDYENLFFMDLTDGYQGLVLLDVKKNGKSLSTGDHYDIDIDKHPAIKQLSKGNRKRYPHAVLHQRADFSGFLRSPENAWFSKKSKWCPRWCPRPVLQKKYAVSGSPETAYLRGLCWSE